MSDTEKRENTRSTNSFDKIGMKMKTDNESFDISDSSSDSIHLAGMKSPFRWESEQETSDNLYGLNPRFIESIGIKLPLDKWVHVSNFRCDKAELKEVLELAGHVVICSVLFRERYAKVMYSHPLEAVQAIAMLNDQVFYGQKLKLTMLPCPMDTIILPKGLANIGPGLGTKGKPLRDIVDQYKNFLKHKDSMVDISIFLHSDSKDWNFESNDFKKSMSNISENSFNVDSLKVNKAGDVSFKRAVSFKTKNVEDTDDMHESPPPSKKSKFEPENNSREYQSIKSHERTDKPSWKSSEKDTSRNKIMQSSRNFQNLTVISQSSTGPARLKPESQSLNTNPPKNLNISKPPGTNDAPGVNMGSSVIPRMTFGAVLPRMPLNLSGPQGSNMGPCIGTPGVNMGPSCPPEVNMGPSGPPAMMNAPMGIMNSGPVEVNMGSIRMNMGPGPAPGVNMNTGPGGYGPPNFPPNSLRMNAPPQDSFELQFRNLPPSTTFPLLCEKISLCGQVLSLQLTTPGCAVARFSQRAHAERCFQVFNGLRIDGCIVEARLV